MAPFDTTRRSSRLWERKLGSAPQNSAGTLRQLPAEIRLRILEEILVSSNNLFFTRTLISKRNRSLSHSWLMSWTANNAQVLRLCYWEETKDKEPLAFALHGSFVTLSLVSKQVRDEAADIFFGRNRWVLHISSRMNSIDWMLQKWGAESLRKIRVLRIEAYAIVSRPGWLVLEELERFVDVVKDGARLRSLSIYWRHAHCHLHTSRHHLFIPHLDSVGEPSVYARKVIKGAGSLPNESTETGHPGLSGSEEMYATWSAKEISLMPLQALRGIDCAVEGYVTESWALWLEECMRADKGTAKGEFLRG